LEHAVISVAARIAVTILNEIFEIFDVCI
jgi:hypothetical protein